MRELFTKLFAMSHFDSGIQITPFSGAHIVYMVLILGGIVATLGVVFPSIIIISLLAGVIEAFSHIMWVKNAFGGIPDGMKISDKVSLVNVCNNGIEARIDENCEVVTEFYDCKKQFVSTSMTRFINSLGGKVIVMGLTLDKNKSHALYNYRRKRLINEMLAWADCDFAFTKESPEVFLIDNRAKDAKTAGFKAMLTLINYCEDELDRISIYLPKDLRVFKSVSVLTIDGEWQEVDFTATPDGVELKEKLSHLTPVYIRIA